MSVAQEILCHVDESLATWHKDVYPVCSLLSAFDTTQAGTTYYKERGRTVPMDLIGGRLDRMDDPLVEDSEQNDDDDEHSGDGINIPCATTGVATVSPDSASDLVGCIENLQGRPRRKRDRKLNSWIGPSSASCSDGEGEGVRTTGRTWTCGTTSSLTSLLSRSGRYMPLDGGGKKYWR